MPYVTDDPYEFKKTVRGSYDEKQKHKFKKYVETQAGYV